MTCVCLVPVGRNENRRTILLMRRLKPSRLKGE